MSKLSPVTKFPAVCADLQRRTCLALRGGSTVEFIPLSIENGFNVESMPSKAFSELYQQLTDYPPERCAALYAQYAMSVGASAEALEELGRLVKLTPKEIQMATAKKASAAKTEKPAAKSAAAKPAAKKTAAKASADGAPEKKVPAETAAALFKQLIMDDKLTDNKIFEKVQAKFGLDDNKRSYVAWYRKDLTKKGMNPPDAK
jgi:hypothetical protein